MTIRIAIFRALQLGDMLCAVPALRAVRAGYPDAEIVLIGLPWARALVARYAYLDGFIDFPGHPDLREQAPRPDERGRFLDELRARAWDLAIQLHGSGVVSNSIVAQIPSARTIGYGLDGLAYVDRGHEIRRLRRVVEHAGLAWHGDRMEFPLGEPDREDLSWTGEASPVRTGPYACLHPGGRSGARWPAERFAAVGAALTRRGVTVVMVGSADEAPLAGDIARRIPRGAVDLTGRTTLGALGALIDGAQVLVGNDSGVAHLAAALGVPSVVLFSPAQVERWAPLDRERHRVMTPMDEVDPAAVVTAVDELLMARGAPSAVPGGGKVISCAG